MSFGIRKRPAKVLLLGLAGFAIYFAIAVSMFRNNEYYLMILGGGFFGIALLVVKSIGSFFVCSLTVHADSIETVTSVGGIIKINFSDLNWDRTTFSDACLALVPYEGEPIFVSAAEYSREDISKLAHHIAQSCSQIGSIGPRGEA